MNLFESFHDELEKIASANRLTANVRRFAVDSEALERAPGVGAALRRAYTGFTDIFNPVPQQEAAQKLYDIVGRSTRGRGKTQTIGGLATSAVDLKEIGDRYGYRIRGNYGDPRNPRPFSVVAGESVPAMLGKKRGNSPGRALATQRAVTNELKKRGY